MKKQAEVQGSVTEHWMDKRLRLRQPINLPGNMIRITAEALVAMNNYRNKLLGTDYSLHELAEMDKDEKKS